MKIFHKGMFYIIFWILTTLVVNIKCNTIVPQIVGGEISPKYYPYQVSIQIPNIFYWRHQCGGSIISLTNVLTAAHCLATYTPDILSVLAGVKNLDETGSRHGVKTIVYHNEYNSTTLQNDIGIITITQQFIYTEKIGPIGFNDVLVPASIKCILTGWGQTYNKEPEEPLPRNLKRIEVNTIDNLVCIDYWPRVTDQNICTYKDINQSACLYDSGGPLVRIDENILVGIVSYGSIPCGQGKPDVFTRVSEYKQWIQEHME